MVRKIVCAANRHKFNKNILILGVRHWDMIMRKNLELIKESKPKIEDTDFDQGFIDNFGQWVDKKEALQIVKDNKQPFDEGRNIVDYQLFSEGIY